MGAVDGNDSILLIIQQQYKKLGYFKFANENGEQSAKSEDETAKVEDSSETKEKTGQVTQVLAAVIERTRELFTDKHETAYDNSRRNSFRESSNKWRTI